MKKFTNVPKTALALSFALLTLGATDAVSQTMTGTVIQPCNNNGAISVTVTGLTPPVTYIYNNWQANQYATHSSVNSTNDILNGVQAYSSQWGNPNVWFVIASDGTNSVTATFTVIPPFTSDSISVTNANCPAQSTVAATNIQGGTSPYTCAWTNMNTTQVFTGNPIAVSNGMYALSITDAAGCTLSSPSGTGTIWVQSYSGVYGSVTGDPANCTNGTATLVPSGGTAPYSYLWSNNATSQILSGLSTTYLSCTITDAIGCQGTVYYYVPQSVTINYNSTPTNATCLQNNGAVTSFVSGGIGPYTYLWSNSATTQNLSNVAGGVYYQVQITDVNGCTGQGGAYVGVTTPIIVNYNTTASSCTAATGGATLNITGGATPYTTVWYTFPSNTSGISISNKPVGSYAFHVTDANGCVQNGTVPIPPVSTLNASISGGNVVCPATTGNLSAQVSGSSPPFTYLWSNSSTSSSVSGVPLGNHTCSITDAAGCKVVAYTNVHQTSPISVGLNSGGSSCLYTADGGATVTPFGGTAPYTYLWSNNQTSAIASNLLSGYHYVTVTDANGCSKWKQVYIPNNQSSNACFCTITGTVYTDFNSNCVQNSGETGIPNIQIHCSGMGYAYTNNNGVYSFQVPTGTYTITESLKPFYPLSSCQSNNQVVAVTAATNCITYVHFGNGVIPTSDLHLVTYNSNWAIPGNNYNQVTVVQNEGTMTESSIKFGYMHDGQLSYSSSSPWSLTQQNSSSFPNWYSITSGFTTLSPNMNSSSYLQYNVPTNIPLNTVCHFEDSIAKAAPISTQWLTDYTPYNNVNYLNTTVVSSYDPNFKEVSPQGSGPQGYITNNDSLLTYVVHFQNEGTYYAQNVIVVDSLDSDLRVNTLRPGFGTHKFTTTINENGVAKFSFANIQLPWKSGYGDVLSSGSFVYSIKMKKNLAIGTQIKNKAAIYFDFNEPITTNTTLNTISKPTTTVSVTEFNKNTDRALLFPNPASTYFQLITSSPGGKGILSLFDITGRQVSTRMVDLETGMNTISETCGHLQSGIYIVELKDGDNTVSKKLVISR